jgi:hypothetical protein
MMDACAEGYDRHSAATTPSPGHVVFGIISMVLLLRKVVHRGRLYQSGKNMQTSRHCSHAIDLRAFFQL